VIAYTEGPSSPFFVYFTFLLLRATIRWQGPGALITGAILSLVLIGLTTTSFVIEIKRPEVDRLIIRNIYLIVASALFAFLGTLLRISGQRQSRLRLAQEMHDGILQTLTAAKLKLHTLATGLEGEQRRQATDVGQLLNQEQRRLRLFLQTARSETNIEQTLPGRQALSELHRDVSDLKLTWNIDIDLNTSEFVRPISASLIAELRQLMAEAIANAVVHGHATRVHLDLHHADGGIKMEIQDNGSGLVGVEGTIDHRRLAWDMIGPRSIRERVERLRGALRLTSTPDGLQLHVSLPVDG
jgi:signal transduction histidine kinase